MRSNYLSVESWMSVFVAELLVVEAAEEVEVVVYSLKSAMWKLSGPFLNLAICETHAVVFHPLKTK